MNRPRMQMFSKTDRVLAAIDGKPEGALTPSLEQQLTLTLIDLPPSQPRKYFNPIKLAQLEASVAEQGILEPMLVRPKPNGRYELVVGERRFRVATSLQLSKVPVIVKELTDTEALEVALVENLQREDLNPVEELEGIVHLISLKLAISQAAVVSLLHRMLNEHKNLVNSSVTVKGESPSNSNATVRVKQILSAIGITNWLSFVSNRLPLLTLPQEVLEALRQGQLEYTKAKIIARIADPDKRQQVLAQAIAEGLSLSQIRQLIAPLLPSKPSSSGFKAKVTQILQQLKKADLDSDKKQQVNEYLDRIQQLLET